MRKRRRERCLQAALVHYGRVGGSHTDVMIAAERFARFIETGKVPLMSKDDWQVRSK